jgi:hypothetical protein
VVLVPNTRLKHRRCYTRTLGTGKAVLALIRPCSSGQSREGDEHLKFEIEAKSSCLATRVRCDLSSLMLVGADA